MSQRLNGAHKFKLRIWIYFNHFKGFFDLFFLIKNAILIRRVFRNERNKDSRGN